MADNCILCGDKNNKDSGNTISCMSCKDAYHATCFQKKFGSSVMPGPDYVCIECSASDVGNSKKKRQRKESGDERVNEEKRPRNSSKTRSDELLDIRSLLVDLKEELKKDMKKNTDEIKESTKKQFDRIWSDLENMKRKNQELEASVEFVSAKYDTMEPTVKQNSNDCANAKAAIDELKIKLDDANARVARMEAASNRTQQDAIRNNLVISGMIKSEKPADTFWRLAELMNAKLNRDEVVSVDLLKRHQPTVNENKNKQAFVSDTLLVRFRSNSAKGALIKAKKELGAAFAPQVRSVTSKSKQSDANTKPRVIFFRDHMTDTTMKLFEATQAKKVEMNYKFTWSKNGQIMMRKDERADIIRINSLSDLDKLPST